MLRFLTHLRRLFHAGPKREPVHRIVPHPRLGDLRFVGSRVVPDGPLGGYWEVTPPGFARPVSTDLGFDAEGSPLPGEVAWLEAFLGDLDGFYARIRPALAAEYAHWVGGSPPDDWRAAFRLDAADPPGLDDEDPAAWQVSYWCEGAQHWFNVRLRDHEVIGVEVDG